ncbi:MAG: hypothetical protein JXQ29_02035 [Planctomycetes bacterium]|nr:hypothetical protein [Planctomycetota bacterium]
MTERERAVRRVAPLLAAAVGLAGCMIMLAGNPEVECVPVPPAGAAAPVPVAAAVQAQVFEDAIHALAAEVREEQIHYALLRESLLAAGLMTEARPQRGLDTLEIGLEIEVERSGSIPLRVASTATFRVLPCWTRVHYLARARAGYRGRPLPPFAYERSATLIESIALFPIAPFFAPDLVEVQIRRDAIHALITHLAAALAAEGDGS